MDTDFSPSNLLIRTHITKLFGYAQAAQNTLVIHGRISKALRQLLPEHEAQLLNYLNATDYEVGLLMYFGPKPKYIRKIFDNPLKRYRPTRVP
jgi:GxxExxY protein